MLERFRIERETAKTVILTMINGGENAYDSLIYNPKFLIAFKKEIEFIFVCVYICLYACLSICLIAYL
jgi:hypothetical protein